ncbi:thioredoxin family protein [Sandaracinomonas limnophila]|uniref:Thioredoxin family protein n=1 Tax=Sandaracinomonas limnophila TaxID=1862386 RepID=A0A437PRA0_9BACT|nr:thioredoxin family protein [Sandaracinomonas limnophila]RVU24785.1 thioredoxin family protein [Sandaracinomonas limnophila]
MKAFILVLFVSFQVLGGGEGWGNDFAEAQKTAKAENKLILLNFSGSDWCGPCIQLKKEVFESETFKTFAGPKLVLVRADFPRLKKNQLEKSQQAKNDLMAEKYNQDGKFPLTVLINADGKVLHKWEGFQPNISKFLQEIESSK